MDLSNGQNNTGTLAQWEAFFLACEIPRERSQSHAAKFFDAFVRPHRLLSTYTKDDYEELGVKLGDRVRKAANECELLQARRTHPPPVRLHSVLTPRHRTPLKVR